MSKRTPNTNPAFEPLQKRYQFSADFVAKMTRLNNIVNQHRNRMCQLFWNQWRKKLDRYVYVLKWEIKIPNTNQTIVQYKIGKSTNAFARLNMLRKEQLSIGTLTIVNLYKTINMSGMETWLKNKLDAYNVKGHTKTEVFSAPHSVIVSAIHEYIALRSSTERIADLSNAAYLNNPLHAHKIVDSFYSTTYDDCVVVRSNKVDTEIDKRGCRRQRLLDLHAMHCTVKELKEKIKNKAIPLDRQANKAQYYKKTDLVYDLLNGWLTFNTTI